MKGGPGRGGGERRGGRRSAEGPDWGTASRWIGAGLASAAFLATAAWLAWACAGLPPMGRHPLPYGDWANRAAPAERHSPEAVTAVTFDFRGFDTFGEECILFTAVFGIGALLRRQPDDDGCPGEAGAVPPGHPFEALRPFCAAAFPALAAYAVYVVAHGHLSPGGGFQGGVLLASAFLLAGTGGRFEGFRRAAHPYRTRAAEALGILGYASVGFAGTVLAGAFLRDVLPLGRLGKLASGGMLPLLNACAGTAVAGGFLSLLGEMLGQARRSAPREGQ